jgi:mRNA-degrading endonuclease RelE of RelBE toxin-antitoxin system
MQSRTTRDFREALAALPKEVQKRARKNFRLWKDNPRHPSLRFKKVHPTEPIYSARVGRAYRALADVEGGVATWFWIGHHDEYMRILSQW